MTDYGVDKCTECGEVTELLLAPRFPHICSLCLFPPPPKDDDAHDARELPEAFGLVDALSPIERLHMQKSNGIFRRGGDDTRGIPEKFNRRGRNDGS